MFLATCLLFSASQSPAAGLPARAATRPALLLPVACPPPDQVPLRPATTNYTLQIPPCQILQSVPPTARHTSPPPPEREPSPARSGFDSAANVGNARRYLQPLRAGDGSRSGTIERRHPLVAVADAPPGVQMACIRFIGGLKAPRLFVHSRNGRGRVPPLPECPGPRGGRPCPSLHFCRARAAACGSMAQSAASAEDRWPSSGSSRNGRIAGTADLALSR